MYLTDITLRDFGAEVFQDARLDGLSDGLDVIGGPQRAGKTTFLEAVRRLGYGVETGADIPPAADEYNLRATAVEDGEEYMVKLTGHGAPSVISTGSGPDRTIEDLYGGVSKRQYHQLFTITLDELKRIPDSVDDAEALSEVLLGAAYGDVAIIPALEDAFGERAHEIGRSYGKPTKKNELRAPMDTIEDGIADRDTAIDQVDEWGEAQEELEEVTDRLADLEDQVDRYRRETERLSVLEDEYESLETYQELRVALESSDLEEAEAMPDRAQEQAGELGEAYEEAVDSRDGLEAELETRAPDGDAQAYKTALLEYEADLEDYDRQVEKWEKHVEDITEDVERLGQRRGTLERLVGDIYADWAGEFDPVLAIRTDSVSESRVTAAADKHTKASEDRAEGQKQRDRATAKIQEYQDQLDDTSGTAREGKSPLHLVARTAVVGFVALLVGIVGAINNVPVIAGGAAAGVLIVGLYFVVSRWSGPDSVTTTRELTGQIQAAQADLEAAEEQITTATERLEGAESTLEEIAADLGLPSDVDPEGVAVFYEEVVEVKAEIQELQQDESDLEEDRDELLDELDEAAATVSEVREVRWDREAPLETADRLFKAVTEAVEDLETARDIAATETSLRGIENDITDLFDSWEAVEGIDPADHSPEEVQSRLDAFAEAAKAASEVLEKREEKERLHLQITNKLESGSTKAAYEAAAEDDEPRFEVFERLAEEFVDAGDVGERRRTVEAELEEAREDLEAEKEARVRLQEHLKELHSDDDIVAARQQISEGRDELERLGEEYAVNRIAQHLTGRLHERFIAEVAGPLIDEASDVFQRITQDYDGLTHNEQFDDLDFEALRDGKPPHGSDELSRATAEQLFLAVRLARIRQLDVSLPVVMDDAITNFDPAHGARTFRTIAELARTHQVLFLTCHPEYVMLAENYGDAGQFWCLDEGRFEGPYPSSDEVYALLHTDRGPGSGLN